MGIDEYLVRNPKEEASAIQTMYLILNDIKAAEFIVKEAFAYKPNELFRFDDELNSIIFVGFHCLERLLLQVDVEEEEEKEESKVDTTSQRDNFFSSYFLADEA